MNKYAFGVILSNQPTKKAIAAQMVKEQVQIKIVVADIRTTLAADKGETVTQFQDQRGLARSRPRQDLAPAAGPRVRKSKL